MKDRCKWPKISLNSLMIPLDKGLKITIQTNKDNSKIISLKIINFQNNNKNRVKIPFLLNLFRISKIRI